MPVRGGFLNSRLGVRIRQKEGLSYGVGSFLQLSSWEQNGIFGSYAIYNPQNAAKLQRRRTGAHHGDQRVRRAHDVVPGLAREEGGGSTCPRRMDMTAEVDMTLARGATRGTSRWIGALVLVVVAHMAATARAQVWVGPTVGRDVAVSSIANQEASGGAIGYGLDLAVHLAPRLLLDLIATAYASNIQGGNDADPYVFYAGGVRWRFGDVVGDGARPFASIGVAGGHTVGYVDTFLGYVQGEVGFAFAPTGGVGAEVGIRDRVGYPLVEGAQVFVHVRFGRLR